MYKALRKGYDLILLPSSEVDGIARHKEVYGWVEVSIPDVDARDLETYPEYETKTRTITTSSVDEETGEVTEVESEEEYQELKQILVRESQSRKNARIDSERNQKLNEMRQLRASRLQRLDELVNIAFLNSWTVSEKTELKNYRMALLNVTETYKTSPAMLDSLDLNTFEWPEEPTEV